MRATKSQGRGLKSVERALGGLSAGHGGPMEGQDGWGRSLIILLYIKEGQGFRVSASQHVTHSVSSSCHCATVLLCYYATISSANALFPYSLCSIQYPLSCMPVQLLFVFHCPI